MRKGVWASRPGFGADRTRLRPMGHRLVLEPDGGVATPGEFALYSLSITVLVMLAYWIDLKTEAIPFRPSRWLVIAAGSLFGVAYILNVIPKVNFAPACCRSCWGYFPGADRK